MPSAAAAHSTLVGVPTQGASVVLVKEAAGSATKAPSVRVVRSLADVTPILEAVSVPETEAVLIPETETVSTLDPEVVSILEPEVVSILETEVVSIQEPEVVLMLEPEAA